MSDSEIRIRQLEERIEALIEALRQTSDLTIGLAKLASNDIMKPDPRFLFAEIAKVERAIAEI